MNTAGQVATVTSTVPLMIREDGADTPVAATCNPLYVPAVNHRVIVLTYAIGEAGAVGFWIAGKLS